MTLLAFTQLRVTAFLAEIDRLAEAEFPYWHSQAALEQLRTLFSTKLRRLECFSSENDPDVIAQECRITLLALFTYLPLLGFVLRSTNVRNAFEVFGPFLRMAGNILEPGVPRSDRKTKLLLSSEWGFSPFTFRPILDLPDFLFIGVPAPESANPLLVPLAGHELGHAVWARFALDQQFKARIQQEIVNAISSSWDEYQRLFSLPITQSELTTDLEAVETWRMSLQWCLRQAEETFCDLLGLRIFGTSYLYAIAYLLAPGLGTRSPEYPEVARRVINLRQAAESFEVEIPPGFAEMFELESPPPQSVEDRYRLRICDVALAQVISGLIATARERFEVSGLATSTDEGTRKVVHRIKQVVPAENCITIADILNGAWMAYADDNLWSEYPTIRDRRLLVLKELVLKNLEIFEIEQILQEP